MTTENETKFLVEDPEVFRSRVNAINEVRAHTPRHFMRRRIYDYPDRRLNERAAWVRVREGGDICTLAYKQRWSLAIDGVEEHEVQVSNFDECCRLLESVGLSEKSYQESYREAWSLVNQCSLTLDEWPWLPPFCEVEGPSEEAVWAAVAQLGVHRDACFSDTVDGVYLRVHSLPLTHENRTAISAIRRHTFSAPRPSLLGNSVARRDQSSGT